MQRMALETRHYRAVPDPPPLPPIEVLVEHQEEVASGRPRRWEIASWRSAPVKSFLSIIALLAAAGVAFTVFLGQDDGDPPEKLLQDWAAAHHTGEPPASVTIPKSICKNSSGDLEALKDCFRDALADGETASGHVAVDLSYPDALDYWATVRPDGTGRYVQRLVTVESRPDAVTGVVRRGDLRKIVTEWVRVECESVRVLPPDQAVLPGFDCENDPDAAMRTATSRPTTREERVDLIRRFACTYESIREHHPC